MKKNLNNSEIIEKLLLTLDLENDNQLAKYLGVKRQQINQFKNGRRVGLTQAIITELLTKLESTPS